MIRGVSNGVSSNGIPVLSFPFHLCKSQIAVLEELFKDELVSK